MRSGLLQCAPMRIFRILLPLLLLSTTPLFAWGEKGHLAVNEAATLDVPSEMPVFFHKAYPQLVYLGYDPDRWRGAGESLEAVNPPEHFLDYEYVADLQLPNDRYKYIEAMVKARVQQRFHVDLSDPGFLPWRAAEMADLLTQQWKLWFASKPDTMERKQIEQNIIHAAGVLGHYIADSANPHHTTVNYNGWVTVPNVNGYPTDCETHFRFESQFVNHAIDVHDVFPKVRPEPVLVKDFFAAALALVRESNSLIDRLYQIDRAGGFVPREGTPEAHAFASDRLATAASTLRDFWWSAYVNGQVKGKSRR